MAYNTHSQTDVPQSTTTGFMSSHHAPLNPAHSNVTPNGYGTGSGYGTHGSTVGGPVGTGGVANTANRMATNASATSKNIFQRLKNLIYRCVPFLSKTHRMNRKRVTGSHVAPTY